MKLLLISLLISIGLVATAYNSAASNVQTRISDDDKTLSIQIDGEQNGHMIHVNQRYNVDGMNALQKEVIKFRTFRSVGILMPFSEMPSLIFGILGFIIFICTLLIMRYQAKHSQPAKRFVREPVAELPIDA